MKRPFYVMSTISVMKVIFHPKFQYLLKEKQNYILQSESPHNKFICFSQVFF